MTTDLLEDGDYAFSEIHVISDLHLGGAPGRQIFSGTKELVALIELLKGAPAGRRVALVINGDFIDFLAEEPGEYFDPRGAIGKLDRVSVDKSFAPIWTALKAYLGTPDRYLVVVLGNHDVELAIPKVLRHFVESLTGNDQARGRLVISTQGHGFAARVMGKRVVCIHGNEADTWNVIDYDRLRRIQTELQLAGSTDSWTPNAGTKLVIDVMNEIKRRYPFVDLLKPETAGVIPILWALDQGTARRLAACMNVGGRLAWDKARRAVGLLSADEKEIEDPKALQELLNAGAGQPHDTDRSADAMIAAAIKDVRDGTHRLGNVSSNGELGVIGALWARITNRPPAQVALEAIERLSNDKTFSRSTSDPTFERLDELVGDADFIVAGHTHLERDLARIRRRGRYFNTGSWARLIRVRPEWLANHQRFLPVWEALKKPTLADLDATQIEGKPLVTTRRTVASICERDGEVRASLRRVWVENNATQIAEPTVSEE